MNVVMVVEVVKILNSAQFYKTLDLLYVSSFYSFADRGRSDRLYECP